MKDERMSVPPPPAKNITDLTGRVAVVIGGTSGLGKATPGCRLPAPGFGGPGGAARESRLRRAPFARLSLRSD
jgi:hypothetical protein